MTLVPVSQTGPSGYVPFPPQIMVEDRTGQTPMTSEVISLEGAMPFTGALAGTCTALRLWLVSALLDHARQPSSMTTYRAFLIVDSDEPLRRWVPSQRSELGRLAVERVPQLRTFDVSVHKIRLEVPRRALVKVARPLTPTPAEELRAITGLEAGRLAEVFGVSRTTFYKWMEGAVPREARQHHLLEAVAHMKDAKRKLPASVDVAVWLRTPVSAGGKSPLDYLQEQRFSTFRGLLLRAKAGEMGLSMPVPTGIASQPMSRRDTQLSRERLSPTPHIAIEDDADNEGEA